MSLNTFKDQPQVRQKVIDYFYYDVKHRILKIDEKINTKSKTVPNSKGKFKRVSPLSIEWQNLKVKHIKRMQNKCHVPDLVQAFPCG